jgi:hypothetical protein
MQPPLLSHLTPVLLHYEREKTSVPWILPLPPPPLARPPLEGSAMGTPGQQEQAKGGRGWGGQSWRTSAHDGTGVAQREPHHPKGLRRPDPLGSGTKRRHGCTVAPGGGNVGPSPSWEHRLGAQGASTALGTLLPVVEAVAPPEVAPFAIGLVMTPSRFTALSFTALRLPEAITRVLSALGLMVG